MTNEKQRKLAVRRELAELERVVKQFDTVVADAQRLATLMQNAAAHLSKLNRESEISLALDELDYLMSRGKYRRTLIEAADEATLTVGIVVDESDESE